jgi:hypothetical protein
MLTGLRADAFRHPLDLQATEALRQLPGLDAVVRMALGPIAEQFFYLDNISASVLVGDRQLPHLHKLLTGSLPGVGSRMPPTLCAAASRYPMPIPSPCGVSSRSSSCIPP